MTLFDIIYNILYKQQIIVNLILNLIFLFKGVLKMEESKKIENKEMDKVAGGKLSPKAKKALRMAACGAAGAAASYMTAKGVKELYNALHDQLYAELCHDLGKS